MSSSVSIELGGRTVTLETGRVARQAHGAVVVREGDAYLLGTVVSAPAPRPGVDFMPLTVEYKEKMAAGGRIPGGFFKREGRAGELEILTCRLIDRSLRPLLPKTWRCETQVRITVFGTGKDSDLESLGILAAAAALHLSDVPFDGPVAGLRVARHNGHLVALPSPDELASSDVDLTISGSRAGLVMLEGQAGLLSDDVMVEVLEETQALLGPVLDAMDALRAEAGHSKRPVPEDPEAPLIAALVPQVGEAVGDAVDAALGEFLKVDRSAGLDAAKADAVTLLGGEGDADRLAASAFGKFLYQRARERTMSLQRMGGRAPDTVRTISGEAGILGSNHGSALFTRGDTQALVSCTLGEPRDAQRFESVHGQDTRGFMLHYNFPPYSVGEARPMRGPGRREIGHGALARRALEVVLPARHSFPYTIRVVSDITESDGSSSMATICGGSLAMMDAGVPLDAPVAGIAMGLVSDGERAVVLSDICGAEDHLGDMDFKVAGTADGISAIQMDNKLGSLPVELLRRALRQATAGRRHILGEMKSLLDSPREGVAAGAPRTETMQVDPKKIGRIIGKGGATIKELQRSTRCRIDVNDDGRVVVMSRDPEAIARALGAIAGLTMELRIGGVYDARIDSVKDFGVFVQMGEHSGLVHRTEWSEDGGLGGAKMGDEVRVQLVAINEKGQLVLSRLATL